MPGQGAFYLRDVSGNTALLDISGRLQVNLAGGSVTSNISGQTVILGSGTSAVSGQISVLSGVVSIMSGVITASVSSGAVSVSSGNISVQSGSITVNSGQIAVSGLFAGLSGVFISGGGAVSGALPTVNLVYDFSGKQWVPMSTAISGSSVTSVWVASGVVTASVSSGAVSVASGSITVNSGTVSVSGLYTAATLQSGAGGISGIGAQGLFVYDFSGTTWNPVSCGQFSGARSMAVSLWGQNNQKEVTITTFGNVDGQAANNQLVGAGSYLLGYDSVSNLYMRLRATVSGDKRLLVSTEGRAPTYSVNAQAITLFSGTAVQSAPYIALMNFGSGTATPVYKIKGLFIGPDASNALVSGQAIKFDVIRCTAFSGGGTLLSGVAMDTIDPAYSGTLAGPTLMKNCGSGVTLDGVYFSYITSTEGPFNAAASALTGENSVFDPGTVQNTNLIALRMPDTKEVVIRSGYGFAVVQSSGNSYTQLTSGAYSFSMIYSVEA